MRMKQSRLTIKYLKNRTITKDNEGVAMESWSNPIAITCEFWSNASNLEREISGQYLSGDKFMRIKGSYEVQIENNHEKYVFSDFSLREGDGICLYSNGNPDYIITSITDYKPLLLGLTRRWQ